MLACEAKAFATLPEAARAELIGETIRYELGAVVVRENEEPEFFYVVAEGRIRLVSGEVPTGILEAGDTFGHEVIGGCKSIATARSAAASVVLKLPRAVVQSLAEAFPNWRREIETRTERERHFTVLRRLDLFASLTLKDAQAAIASLRLVNAASHSLLSGVCSIISEGRVSLLQDGTPFEDLGPGDILLGEPAIATTQARVFEVSSNVFDQCLQSESVARAIERISAGRRASIAALNRGAFTTEKPPQFVRTSFKRHTALAVNLPEYALEACLRTIDVRLSLDARPPITVFDKPSLDDLTRVAEARGYLCRLMRLDSRALSHVPLPAVICSGKTAFQTILSISSREVISAHTSLGLLRQPLSEFTHDWDGWMATVSFVPELGAHGTGLFALLKSLRPLVLPWRRLFAGIVAITILVDAFSSVQPFFSSLIVDRVLVNLDRGLLKLLIIGAVFSTLLHMLSSALREWMMTYPSVSIGAQLQQGFFRHILSLSVTGATGWNTAQFLSRFDENSRIFNIVSRQGISLLVDTVSVLVYLSMMAALNGLLAALAFTFMAAWCLSLLVSSSILRNANKILFQKIVRFESFFLDAVTGVFTLKALGAEKATEARGLELIRDSQGFACRLQRLQAHCGGVNRALYSGAGIAVLAFGAFLSLSGRITAGQLIGFQGLMGLAFAPLLSLSGFWNELQDLRVCLERTGDVLCLPKEPQPASVVTSSLTGKLEFTSVTFQYPGTSRPALRKFSLRLLPGQKVALVGRSGSGKTTVANLLAALYEPTAGTILFDDTDISLFDRGGLRRQLGFVEQQPYLFNGTIRENITIANPAASFDEIAKAAELAGAHSFIAELPMRYDTQIGERGMALSGGQRQRIVIARALLNRPRLLVLDEATSALDNESEAVIQENLDRAMKGCTTLVIAHRLRTVRNADFIAVLDEGCLVEQGTHNELMAADGLYRHLWAQGA